MFTLKPYPALLALVVLLVYARPALAFGAGNIASISKVEGQNWRHGDIEDTLLTLLLARAAGGKKFDKLAVSRVYFGNWLRDYSQAIDVGTVKAVSAEAIRLLLSVLGFLTFGYGSKEFEVTADRLGCYRPEDHIGERSILTFHMTLGQFDPAMASPQTSYPRKSRESLRCNFAGYNPKGYPAPGVDARQYDRRLRGPIDERVELAIDERTGLKNYIANENVNIMTTALHIRKLFGRCIELGRSYNRNRNKDDFYEALRLMGTGLHACEDYLAHSNYTELALIELGERDVFPHVGRNTRVQIEGARHEVYPIVTGTFGGVDFLHSVTGEVSDKLTQNELDELEGTLQNNSKNDTSYIEDLLDKIPDGLIGGGGDKKQELHEIQDNANSSQLENMSVSPREPEEYTRYIQDIFKQIMPAIEFHDELLKSIGEAIEKIPVLPKIVEQLEEQMSVWVFSIMAPLVVPVLQQIKNELRTGSAEIIASSENEQHIVFNDDDCSDPTHSMLSKDHFSNILNEAAGKTASKVVAWVVPQLMEAWDDDSIDIERTMNRIIHGVMHHPAQRDQGEDGAKDCRQIMIRSVEEWWNQKDDSEKDEFRRKLSREGVQNGENHKEGVHDTGHGCGKPLGVHKNFAQGGTFEDRIAGAAADAIVGGITGGISDAVQSQTGFSLPTTGSGSSGRRQEQSSEGGLGGLLSNIGGSLLSGFKSDEKESFSGSRQDNNSTTESRTEYGHSGGRYGQAEVSRTEYSGGGESETYRRYEQDDNRQGDSSGYGYEERTESRPSRHGGYEQRTERRYETGENTYEERFESHQESSFGGGGEDRFGGGGGRRNDDFGGREGYGGGFGGGRRDEFGGNESYGGGGDGGFGGGRRNEDGREGEFGGGFGGRRDDNFGDRQEGFGGGRRDDDEREEGFGGGFGGGRRSGERRRDDDNGERRGGWGF
ncbi:putative Heterokaryon incompatibility protein Het-C-domain-containing protein [Seiridium cardinale]|uniref:Heterokaryon incompatibility protein Het-C-domain-containing protein n=1 Tax=Seiridium cardinale TaxID=138064 RepID=A0ABR2XNV7_9PEZI